MVGEEITEIFGAPSTVSSSGERGSIWVYDRVAAGQVVSEKVGDVTSLFFKGDEQGDRPRVFTVIVTFDGAGVARDFSYHTARF
jgi:hypothetical protein